MIGDDRLVPLTWIVFAPLALLTAIFGPLLVLFPESTRTYWAWEIRPAMSAVWAGAAYTFGGIALTAMLTGRSWRAARVPVIATWLFSIVMLLATLLHLDRFFLGTAQFYVWLAIYLVLPVALPLIWLLNQRHDPGLRPDDMLVPRAIRIVGAAAGAIIGLTSLLMVLSPPKAAAFWPWQLTPLMSRVIAGWLAFMAAGLICLPWEKRYIAYRKFLPAAAIWFAILFVASLFHLDNFNFNRAGAWVWLALSGGVPVVLLSVYFYLEQLYRTQRQVARVPGAQPEV
jgi:heme exporter protein D